MMKTILKMTMLLLLVSSGVYGQRGIGTNTPDKAAILELASTSKGFLPPRMSTIERDGISTPATGLVIYNTTAACVQFFNGALWFDTCTQTTDGPPNSNLTVASPTYQGASVIDATGIGYNGEAVPSASTITVDLTNTDATNAQGYGLSATDAGTGLIYDATGTIAAGVTIAVVLTHNAVVMPALESGVLTMPLTGANNTLNLLPRIDIKSIPASATQVTDVVYGTQTWMDRNLGARQVAAALNDVFSYGNYYQWGRPADGHEITVWNGTSKNSGRGLADVTATLAADANPSYANFITSGSDWLATPAGSGIATLWATANQGPCPANYHVPTNDEWNTADAFNSGWDDSTDTYDSTLKLPSSGYRDRTNGALSSQGTHGYYWSSTVSGTNASLLDFSSAVASTYNYNRAFGFTVRCLKDGASTASTAPGAPGIGTATAAGSASATVAYTAPAYNGGSVITGYTATSIPGGISGSVSQAGSGTITVTGLTNGTAYTFTVTATNAISTGAASAASNSVVTTPSLTSQVASNGSGGTYTFLNHNLGADTSLDPHTPVKGLNGDYYQWGKNAPDADVDNLIGSTWGDQGGTTANGNWTPSSKGPQDPCPAGYRVPSQAEWAAVDTYNTAFRTGLPWSSGATEFGNALHYGPDTSTKLLTLPAAGDRNRTSGALVSRGSFGLYWTSTELTVSKAYSLYFSSSNVDPASYDNRTYGFSVRCIAE
jgi:uncharacterized protein (TIGR02145 family)